MSATITGDLHNRIIHVDQAAFFSDWSTASIRKPSKGETPMKRFASALLTLLMVINFPIFASAQINRGSLAGTVRDPQGAAVKDATVTVRDNATGEELTTTTNDLGTFSFPSVSLGKHTVTVQAEGFKKSEVPDIIVESGTTAKITVPLEVGARDEQITVTAETQEVINTVSPVLSNTITNRQVKDLPLPTRNPLDLARLQAGIAVVGTDTRNASVGGLRGTATNVTRDGINAMDNFVKTSSFFDISAPSLNATQEFSITTGTVGADAGRGVAQVNTVTKSGTNELHGNAFYRHRNDAFNANTFFNNASDTEKEIQKQHFFGFNVGGPVWLPKIYDGRNQSFWFFAYEGFREPFSVTRNRTVLTESARNGIYRYIGANGQLTSVNLLQIGAFPNLNPLTTSQLNFMPLPNNDLNGDGLNTGGFRYNVAGRSPNDKISIRADQKLFDSERLGSHKVEWVFHRGWFLLTPDTFNGLEAPFPGRTDHAEQSSTRTLTAAAIHSTFGSRATNEFRAGHQRAPVGFLRTQAPEGDFFINLGSVTDLNNTFMSQGRNTTVYQFNDNFSYLKGTHTFRGGVEIQSVGATTFNDAGIQPTVNLNSNTANSNGILNAEFPNLPAGSAGTSIANAARGIYHDLVGLLGSGSATFNVTSPTSGFVPGATRERLFRYREASFYFQDQWRARRNLTLNYGMRYEFLGVTTIPNGLAIQPRGGYDGIFGISGAGNLFNPGVLNGTAGTVIDFVSGDTGIPLHNNDRNNFAPFAGFAYSPEFESGILGKIFGSGGRSSIRGGFSISYLRDGFTVVSNALGVGTTNPGLIQTAANTTPTGTLTEAGVALTTPTFMVPITDVQNFAINPNNGLWAINPNLRTPYVQQWSFGIERELAANLAFEARYVANHAVKIFRAQNYNEVNIFENGFLQEFLNAQRNLQINGGNSFAPGAPGTVALPILTQLFTGRPASQGFASTTFINNLENGNVGTMASTLAFSPTYAAGRTVLNIPNFFVANPFAGFAQVLENGSFSNYHSLQLEIRRRSSAGLQMQANYTFSKAITDSDGSQSTLESARTLRNLSLNRRRSNLDQTHRFIANAIYELPFGPGKRFLSDMPVVKKVVEGWTFGTIVAYQTRPPTVNFSSGRTTFNSFNPGNNPANLVGMSFEEFQNNLGVFRTPAGIFFINPNLLDIVTNPITGRLVSSRLKPGILEAPEPGTFGNFPINALAGPNFSQVDFSLVKRTTFMESRSVEFRVTFLNAFNHPNFVYNGNAFDSGSFGQITGTSGTSRVIHFELGVNF
jgi:hypothetical protein